MDVERREVLRTKWRSLHQSTPPPTSVDQLYKSDTRGVVCQCNDWVGGVGEGTVMSTVGKQNTLLWAVLGAMVEEVRPPPPSIPHLPLVFHNPHAQSGTRPRLFLSCSSDRWRRIAKIKAKWRSCHPVSLVRLRMPRPNPLTMFSRCFWFGWVYLSQKRTGWPLKKHKKPNQRVLTAHINMIRSWYIQTIPKPSSLFSKCTFQPNLKKISYLECCHPYA